MHRWLCLLLLVWSWSGMGLWERAAIAAPPNILFVLCDDLGYGDLHCLNPEGKIPTPNFDRLAKSGMVFRDAHSGSAVCTPTRYGVLTGRYAWRSKLQSGVLGGLSPRLIEPGRMTVASLLKKHGYNTACIGKWHLGLDWVVKPGKTVTELNIESPDQVHNVDYGQPFSNGPTAVGFDTYFGISASLDMVPYAYLHNDRVTAELTVDRQFPLMLGREGSTRLGPGAKDFEASNVLPRLTREAILFLGRQATQDAPFFLYLPYASPHTPIVPTPEWQGKSNLNPYADFVMQQDACLGELLDGLERSGRAQNTLVIVTSDNGCSPQAKFPELLAKGHNPSGIFRGTKADIFEGGHRVPFLVRWPLKVEPGRVSDRLICLVDLLATCADLVGAKLPDVAAEDSVSFLPTLLSDEPQPERVPVVHHSINGSFAIREGRWKLCLCPDSGGWSAPRPGTPASRELPDMQLFDLVADPSETTNLADQQPAVVAQLRQRLEQFVAEGRSTPGAPQQNAVEVQLVKSRGR